MENLLTIGVISKPQGIKGEVKVVPLTDDWSRFKKLKEVLIDDKCYKVVSARVIPDAVLLLLDGVFDRNGAELLRGKELKVERKNAVELKKDNYFIVDIIGCDLLTDDGEKIGEIIDVTKAKTDIFTVRCLSGKILRFPFLKDLVKSVDVASKTFTVYRWRLDEVSCYED